MKTTAVAKYYGFEHRTIFSTEGSFGISFLMSTGLNVTAHVDVLHGPKTGSSAVGALLQATDLVKGLELILLPLRDDGAVTLPFEFAELTGLVVQNTLRRNAAGSKRQFSIRHFCAGIRRSTRFETRIRPAIR